MDATDQFAGLLRAGRKKRNFTQYELAERATCSESAIRKFEAGQRRPSEQVAEMLAGALGLGGMERVRFLHAARGNISAVGGEELLPPTNLPAQLTTLIGRDADVESLTALLRQDDVRLVTVVGPPGIGKTRLAGATAAALRRDFEDGVFLVSLVPLRDPAGVLAAIAGALGLRDSGREPISLTLKDYLRTRHLLLVLDNFEQVIGAATAVTDQLGGCPRLKVLVTSRELLHVRGERHYDLSPLALPDPEHEAAPDKLADYSAVRLFVERAREVAPNFALTGENAATVARICNLVDGLPLAIELIAARVRLLPPAALLERLQGKQAGRSGSLQVLSGGARDLPQRHRTLRDAIGWSYELLDEDERRLFMRLGVFSGGWTLPTAEAVCNAHGDIALPLLDGMTALRDKNLIRHEAGADGRAEPRFAMLETIREYAATRLQESGEAEETRRRHAEYFLALALATEPQLLGPDQQIWLEQLESDRADLGAALYWLLERGEIETAAALAAALARFWLVHSHLKEGRDWLTRVLAAGDNISPLLRARVLDGAGVLARVQGDYAAARIALEESLSLARSAGDVPLIAAALKDLGTVYDYQGDLETATTLYQQSLAAYQQLDDSWGESACLNNIATLLAIAGKRGDAITLYQQALAIRRRSGDLSGIAATLNNLAFTQYNGQDYDAAATLWSESLLLYEELGDRAMRGVLLTNLGELARKRGDLAQANELLERSLLIRRRLGDRRGLATTLFYLGEVAHQSGDFAKARDLLRQCIVLLRDMAAKLSLIDGLTGFSHLLMSAGELENALLIYAAAQRAREDAGAPLSPGDLAEQERYLAIARAQLAAEDWDAAWQKGTALTLDDAVTFALTI